MPELSPGANFKGRIPELDGIRGIAIAMVLAHHYFFLPIAAPPGTFWSYVQAAGRLAWSGVDLFFVLSGFLAAVGVSLAALATTLAVCELSWLAFEKPLILIGHKVGYKPATMRNTESIADLGAQSYVRR